VGTARINVGINVPGMATERSGPEGLKESGKGATETDKPGSINEREELMSLGRALSSVLVLRYGLADSPNLKICHVALQSEAE
jgi:hypothetical protein